MLFALCPGLSSLLFSCLLNVLNCMKKQMACTTSYEAKEKMSAGVQTRRLFLVFSSLFDPLFSAVSDQKSLQTIILGYYLKEFKKKKLYGYM